jgi:hypothetical protein
LLPHDGRVAAEVRHVDLLLDRQPGHCQVEREVHRADEGAGSFEVPCHLRQIPRVDGSRTGYPATKQRVQALRGSFRNVAINVEKPNRPRITEHREIVGRCGPLPACADDDVTVSHVLPPSPGQTHEQSCRRHFGGNTQPA